MPRRTIALKIVDGRFYSFRDVLSQGLAVPEQMATYIDKENRLTYIDRFGRLVVRDYRDITRASKDGSEDKSIADWRIAALDQLAILSEKFYRYFPYGLDEDDGRPDGRSLNVFGWLGRELRAVRRIRVPAHSRSAAAESVEKVYMQSRVWEISGALMVAKWGSEPTNEDIKTFINESGLNVSVATVKDNAKTCVDKYMKKKRKN
jgi:hypothetical protein